MKNFVKDTIGHFEVLIDHTTREYEVSPKHVLERMIQPLCKDFSKVLIQGTKNDAWQVLQGFSEACKEIIVEK